MKKAFSLLFCLLFFLCLNAQDVQNKRLLTTEDFNYLKDLTKAVMDSARVYPGQIISKDFGANATGITLIRPGGRGTYPAFWIRDYAMSIETGFVSTEEQKQMLLLTAATQCDQTWISASGSMIPVGAIPDHIRIDDSKPIFFPGTYNYSNQGGKTWGMTPPYCDQYYFVHMAYQYIVGSNRSDFLLKEINGTRLIDRLEMAYKVPPTKLEGVLVNTTDDFRGIDFGFRDVINITGELCFPSLLKYKASLELAELFNRLRRNDKAKFYLTIAAKLKQLIPAVFADARGMLLASTGKGKQPDVWSTSLAVYFGILEGDQQKKTCQFLRDAYQKGSLASKGNVRHILTTDDFNTSTAWEFSLAQKNSYQNGAYWGTPTGWVCYAIAKVDIPAAQKLAKEYIDDLRVGDYRKGIEFGAPWECYNSDKPQNAVYLTSVSCPLIVFKNN